MSYNPDLQYRCTIIRGKSISRMDDYLPIYAEILNEICPIPSTRFNETFDLKLSHYIKDDNKTIKNHRTENVDKLLGMFFEKDGIIYISERTKKFLEDNDQPAFFKSVCFRFQQPNGSQKINTTIDKFQNGINFKPYHFILALLKSAALKNIVLTKEEVAYYVLNSLQVLQGKVKVVEVLETILSDRGKNLHKKVETAGKAYSYYSQHINEQFDLLELTNLIRKDDKSIWLNNRESIAIDFFVSDLKYPMAINYSKYNFDEKNIAKKIKLEWQQYFGRSSKIEHKLFFTKVESLYTPLHRKPKLEYEFS